MNQAITPIPGFEHLTRRVPSSPAPTSSHLAPLPPLQPARCAQTHFPGSPDLHQPPQAPRISHRAAVESLGGGERRGGGSSLEGGSSPLLLPSPQPPHPSPSLLSSSSAQPPQLLSLLRFSAPWASQLLSSSGFSSFSSLSLFSSIAPSARKLSMSLDVTIPAKQEEGE